MKGNNCFSWESIQKVYPESLKSLDTDFFCSKCSTIMICPYLSPCGHNFCLNCLNKLIASCDTPTCPLDKESLKAYSPFLNKHLQKKIEKIIFKCPNNSGNCKWEGQIFEFESHYNKCEFVLLLCSFCESGYLKKDYGKHLEENLYSHFLNLETQHFSLISQNKENESFLKEKIEIMNKDISELSFENKELKLKLEIFSEELKSIGLKLVKYEELFNSKAKTPKAKGVVYELIMSSKYNGPPNTYEQLQNDTISMGAGTNQVPNSFIEAKFPFPVLVSNITLAGPSGMAGGWSSAYTNGLNLQYSEDEINWKTVLVVNGVPEGIKTFEIEGIIGQYWRLINLTGVNGGYAATGVFRFE